MAAFKIIEDFYAQNEVVEVPVVEKYIPNYLNVKTCLYVGVRPEGWGGTPSPNSLELALREIAKRGYVDGLEIWPAYVDRITDRWPCWLRTLHEADITKSTDIERIKAVSGFIPYQLVIWWHGPEHARSPAAGKRGILNCLKLGRRVLVGTPWDPGGHTSNTTYGGFEGDPDNPHESHGWQIQPEALVKLGLNVIGLNCKPPEEESDLDHYGHMIAWSD